MEVDDKIVGTYWMVLNKKGYGRVICQGDKPTLNGESNGWISNRTEEDHINWLFIDPECRINDFAYKGSELIHASDFKDLKFPKITIDDPPMQIEITKSGKVYQIVEI